MKTASKIIADTIKTTLTGIHGEAVSRAYRASNHLKTASLYVLRGQRHGRQYRVPHTKRYYTASAPGESPAVRTGAFRLSWGTHVRIERQGNVFRCISSIESSLKAGEYLLGDILEEGKEKMKPRPYKNEVRRRAEPSIKSLYMKPFI